MLKEEQSSGDVLGMETVVVQEMILSVLLTQDDMVVATKNKFENAEYLHFVAKNSEFHVDGTNDSVVNWFQCLE